MEEALGFDTPESFSDRVSTDPVLGKELMLSGERVFELSPGNTLGKADLNLSPEGLVAVSVYCVYQFSPDGRPLCFTES